MTEGNEAPRPIRVLICTPVYGSDVKRGYSWSLARAMRHFLKLPYDGEKDVDVSMVWSSNLVDNRHRLVSRAFEFEATHLLWIDADMKFPEDAVARMLNHSLPIVAVNYPTKEAEPRPTAYRDEDDYVGPVWTQEKDTGLCKVSSCGFGLMLCDMRVFEAIDLPFFQFTPSGQDKLKTETEDVFFCRKCREKGIDVYIDHDLSKQVAHCGDWEFTNAHADIAQAAKQKIYRGMPTSGPETPL